MMMTERVARPYARALFEIAVSTSREAQIAEELAWVVATIDQSSDLMQFLWHPQVSHRAKIEVIGRVFEGQVDTLILNFLSVVTAKGRERLLPKIFKEYQALWDGAQGRVHAEVESAVALTEAEQTQLSGILSQLTGKTVQLAVSVVPELLGGAVVRMGDRVMDGSLSNKLAVLGERLRNGSGGGYVVEH
ncbi:MAG: ATP synthase F1 subunit delta [Firmicutes bacterium]|jgi:F-type H+-transporting ATPase subunit delta|nr:ATP synthase F1 subunit delta [Bacillota bacterium]